MNVSELFDLTYWVTEEIVEAGLPQKYQALITLVKQAAKANVESAPFKAEKDDLIASQI